tara:strand:+ start:2191 stop:2796 length:606 start_codon:yes stop_codon:yes gene_type:complete
MSYLLFILLLFIACSEEDVAQQENIYGCTIDSACNFDPDANIYDDSCWYAFDECCTCEQGEACLEYASMMLMDEFGAALGSQGDYDSYGYGCLSAEPGTSEEDGMIPVPSEFALSQNFPNPFHSSTSINLDIPSDDFINVSIYNSSNELVRVLLSDNMSAGYHTLTWEGLDGNGEETPPCYYKVILTSSDNECFRNMKKEE